jgi:large subunit ribosomal protein L5
MTKLREQYKKDVMPALAKKFNYTSPMAIPKVEKIVVNMGLGEAIQNAKLLDTASEEMAAITGQKPVITKAKKAIAAFKLRKGMPIGCMVTLRGERMYEFLDRLINIALPRVRDFRGVSTRSFDGRGNYTIGLKDQFIFPEIDIGKTDKIRGLNITIVTTAKSDDESRELLAHFGMPFMKRAQSERAGGGEESVRK